MTYEGLLNNSVFIRTRYSSQNILGDWEFTYSSASTTTKCRISPLSASERIDRTGLFDDVRYKCFLLSGANVSRDSQIEYRSEYYRVKDTIIDSSFHHKTALLQLVT